MSKRAKKPDIQAVKIKIELPGSNQIHYTVEPGDSLSGYFENFCQKKQLNIAQVQFTSESGQVIPASATPSTLGIKGQLSVIANVRPGLGNYTSPHHDNGKERKSINLIVIDPSGEGSVHRVQMTETLKRHWDKWVKKSGIDPTKYKCFAGGRLIDVNRTPLELELTHNQTLHLRTRAPPVRKVKPSEAPVEIPLLAQEPSSKSVPASPKRGRGKKKVEPEEEPESPRPPVMPQVQPVQPVMQPVQPVMQPVQPVMQPVQPVIQQLPIHTEVMYRPIIDPVHEQKIVQQMVGPAIPIQPATVQAPVQVHVHQGPDAQKPEEGVWTKCTVC